MTPEELQSALLQREAETKKALEDAAFYRNAAEIVAAKYHELIFEVQRVFPGEERHQTALRYIREAERNAASGPDKEAKP